MTREQLSEGVKKLLALGVAEFGLHAFLVSNTTDDDYYPALAKKLFKTAVELHEETGANFTFVNLSGGIGIPYRPYEKETDIRYIGEEVKLQYDRIVAPSGLKLQIFTELGRYITGPFGYLVTRAIHKKETHKKYIGRGCLRGQSYAPSDVRGLSSHYGDGQGDGAADECGMTWSAPSAKTTISSQSTDRCRRRNRAIYWSSTTLARTALRWATTTTASSGARNFS